MELLQTRQIGLLLGFQTRGFLFYIYIYAAPPSLATGCYHLLLVVLLPPKLFCRLFLRFKLQIYFESSVLFSYMPHSKDFFMVDVSESELSSAQTDVKHCLKFECNCGLAYDDFIVFFYFFSTDICSNHRKYKILS